jgi:DNA-binding GntR family transcriptional regulator
MLTCVGGVNQTVRYSLLPTTTPYWRRARTIGSSASPTTLRDAAELYRQWRVPAGTTSRDIAGEHQAILDAVLAHDADLAASLLTAHIRTTTNALLEAQHEPGEQAEKVAAT